MARRARAVVFLPNECKCTGGTGLFEALRYVACMRLDDRYRCAMWSSMFLFALTLLSGRYASAGTLDSKGLPSNIEIELSYQSISYHKADHFVISIKDGQAKRGTESVPIGAVANLVAAIQEPRTMEPSLANLGMSVAWLAAERGSALQSYYRRYPSQHLDANQEAYFGRMFSDPRTAFAWMNSWSRGEVLRLDDYPIANVRLDWPDGTSYELTSGSWFVFMIPWLAGPDKTKTFNADISRAVAALLPEDAVNQKRLAGETLSAEYTDSLLEFQLHEQLRIIGAEDAFDGQLESIKKRFTITSMSEGALLSDDLNGEPSLQMHLKNALLPENVSIYMTLWTSGDRIANVSDAISVADRCTQLTLSVPWLKTFLSRNRDWSTEIRVVQNQAISQHLATSLLNDLRKNGKAELASMLQPIVPRMAYLYLNGPGGAYSRWFVLPNREMLLWNYKIGTPLQNELRNVRTWEWYGHVGVGVLFSPEGHLL